MKSLTMLLFAMVGTSISTMADTPTTGDKHIYCKKLNGKVTKDRAAVRKNGEEALKEFDRRAYADLKTKYVEFFKRVEADADGYSDGQGAKFRDPRLLEEAIQLYIDHADVVAIPDGFDRGGGSWSDPGMLKDTLRQFNENNILAFDLAKMIGNRCPSFEKTVPACTSMIRQNNGRDSVAAALRNVRQTSPAIKSDINKVCGVLNGDAKRAARSGQGAVEPAKPLVIDSNVGTNI